MEYRCMGSRKKKSGTHQERHEHLEETITLRVDVSWPDSDDVVTFDRVRNAAKKLGTSYNQVKKAAKVGGRMTDGPLTGFLIRWNRVGRP